MRIDAKGRGGKKLLIAINEARLGEAIINGTVSNDINI